MGETVYLPEGDTFPFWDDQTDYTTIYHVSNTSAAASDDNPGTEAEPFLTIGRAARVAEPGQKVVVHSGVYRECVRPARGGTGPAAMIAYEAAPGDRVVLRGSELWRPDFSPSDRLGHSDRDAGIWSAGMPVDWFANGYNPFTIPNIPDCYASYGVPFTETETHRLLNRRGCLFASGSPVRQVLRYSDLHACEVDAFWIEPPGLRICFRPADGRDPRGESFEVAAREQAFAPAEGGLSFIRVTGLHVEYVATGLPFPQRGALSCNRGNHWIIEDCVVSGVNGLGIDIGNESGSMQGLRSGDERGRHILRRNRVAGCGACGIAGAGNNDYSLIEDNVVEDVGYHNVERIMETAGIKLHAARSVLIRRNVFRRMRHAPGLWLDWSIRNTRTTANLFHDIRSIFGGIYVEASRERNIVDHNVLVDIRGTDCPTSLPLKGAGVTIDIGERCTVVHNLFVGIEGYAVQAHLSQRNRIVDGKHGLCRSHRVLNNLVMDCPKRILFTHPETNTCDGNLYQAAPGSSFRVQWPEPGFQLDLAAWQDHFGFDRTGDEQTVAGVFNAEGGDMELDLGDNPPLAVPVPELHGTSSNPTPGPFALKPGRHRYRLPHLA